MGTGKKKLYDHFVKLDLKNITKIKITHENTIFLDQNGDIWFCGKYGSYVKYIKTHIKLKLKAVDISFSISISHFYILSDKMVIYRLYGPTGFEKKKTLDKLMDVKCDYLQLC